LLIAQRLREARQKAGLSVHDINQITGISTGNISGWEKGKYLPGANALISLSKLYNVATDWILKGEEVFPKDCLESELAQLIQECPPEKRRLIFEMAKLIAKHSP
jgi:transcriptional regulator with XRE-family HTH domain